MMIGESGTSHTGDKHYYYKCAGAKRKLGCKKKSVKKKPSDSVNKTYTEWLMDANNGDIFKAAVAAQDSGVKNAAKKLGYDSKTINNVGSTLHDQASGMKRTEQLKNQVIKSGGKKTSTTTSTSKNKTTSTGSNRRMSGKVM